MAVASLEQRLGSGVMRAAKTWFSPHMDAACRAVAERIPLVDLVLEIRDARRIIVLNKMDLSNRSEIKEWMRYFEQQNCISFGVNSHNKDNIKEFLKFLQAQVKELKKNDHSSYTATIMLVGIPNVGKSALANSLHQIGRISAAEKGKLKHAVVSPIPGETKDISSLKIGSHPNIYVLDTPGILPPKILDVEVCSKLALTGAVKDCLVGEKELAQYFLATLNLSDEYKKWEKLSTEENERSTADQRLGFLGRSELDAKRKRQYPTDHTQDFVVHDARHALFETISTFRGDMEKEKDLSRLVETQFTALQEAFRVASESGEGAEHIVAAKLLNLYRTGRLGHYTLDSLPRNIQ